MGFFSDLFNWSDSAPSTDPRRVMCSSCKYHDAAPAGWIFDRCHHPNADPGNVVRNDHLPMCRDVRSSTAQCGYRGKWFVQKESGT